MKLKRIFALGLALAMTLSLAACGSKTSTSQELLDAVMPQAAVISVGEDRNELPKTQVLDRLSENGAAVFRTDLNGTIVMASNGDMLHIFMEKDEEH